MPKRIEYGSEALRMLQRMDRKTATRIIDKVEQLAIDPASLANNIKRLKGGDGLMRLRVGDWRVIYRDGVILVVERIAPRSKAYD